MADLGPAVGALADVVGPAVSSALGALAKTVVGVLFLGALSVSVAAYLVSPNGGLAVIVVVVPSLAGLVVVTGLLAVKNAAMGGALAAVQRVGLGARVVTLLFGRLGVTDDSSQGERGGAVGRALERVPLRDASTRLTAAVESLLAERAAKSGVRAWVARALMAQVLRKVEGWTLERFRTEDSAHGGVDLRLVRDELGRVADSQLGSVIRKQLNRLNVLVLLAYVALVAALGVGATRLG